MNEYERLAADDRVDLGCEAAKFCTLLRT